MYNLFFFFFQAEDGIRDPLVTGVQTCALPISGLDVEGDVVDGGDGAERPDDVLDADDGASGQGSLRARMIHRRIHPAHPPTPGTRQLSLVVISCLEEVDPVVAHQIHDAVLGGEPAAPHIRAEVLERLRLPDSLERVAHHGFHDLEGSPSDAGSGFDPPREIFPELDLEDRDAPLATRGQAPAAVRPRSAPFPSSPARAVARRAGARRSWASGAGAPSRPGSPARRRARARRLRGRGG